MRSYVVLAAICALTASADERSNLRSGQQAVLSGVDDVYGYFTSTLTAGNAMFTKASEAASALAATAYSTSEGAMKWFADEYLSLPPSINAGLMCLEVARYKAAADADKTIAEKMVTSSAAVLTDAALADGAKAAQKAAEATLHVASHGAYTAVMAVKAAYDAKKVLLPDVASSPKICTDIKAVKDEASKVTAFKANTPSSEAIVAIKAAADALIKQLKCT